MTGPRKKQSSCAVMFVALFAGLVCGSVRAEDGAPRPEQPTAAADKSRFTLFNPTPRQLMRDMSTDRPDTTESPYTVDAGHVQFELSLVDYAFNDDEGVQSDALSLLPSNVKVGLLNNVDLQLVFTPYARVEAESEG